MALLRLDMLPMEVLQDISHALDASHKPSMASLALVNRTLHRAATPAVFRELVVHVTTPQRLAEDVERWDQILQANDSLLYVRNIVVTGDTHRHLSLRRNENGSDTAASRPESFLADETWVPLAKLVEKLSGLRDMHFHSGTFPSCLLASFRMGNLSACRLHLPNFRLRSLRFQRSNQVPEPLVLTPEDLAIITSSNLHAICLNNIQSSWIGTLDYLPDAVFEFVARAGPKLREVKVVQTRLKARPRGSLYRPYPGLRFEQILDSAVKPPGSKAALTSLTLRGRQPQLQQWQQHTDFTVLRTLKMTGYTEADILMWATHTAHFPALSCLEIQTPETDASSVADFLSSVPGLQDLSIVGAVDDSTLMTIEQKHGLTLHHLSIPSWACSADGLMSLKEACPHLSSLAIKVHRTQGDTDEVAMYTALGTYPKLHTLSLELDCAIEADNEAHADAMTKTTNNQRAFINCAIDIRLVASIFDNISGAKPAGSAPLHSLELNVVNAGVIVTGSAAGFCDANRSRVYAHFARKWSCHLHPRDDWQGGVVVMEQDASKKTRERIELLGARSPGLGDLEEAFRGLWPGTGVDWRDEWKSFGLAD